MDTNTTLDDIATVIDHGPVTHYEFLIRVEGEAVWLTMGACKEPLQMKDFSNAVSFAANMIDEGIHHLVDVVAMHGTTSGKAIRMFRSN